jgi:hypothetical protein
MNKTRAIARTNRRHPDGKLTRDTTIFASCYGAMPFWWLEIPLARIFVAERLPLNLLLYDRVTGRLHHLVVPVAHFRSNLGRFAIQLDTESVSLQLGAEPGRLFRDMKVGERGLSLAQFLCPDCALA